MARLQETNQKALLSQFRDPIKPRQKYLWLTVLLCLWSLPQFAQFDTDCFSADILCDFSDFPNGSTFSNSGAGGVGLSCKATDIDNPIWMPFLAGPGDVYISALAITCTPGSGMTGAIITVWDGCPGFVAPECIMGTDCFNYPFGLGNIPIELTVPDALMEDGQIYYLTISGCMGATCSFEVEIDGETLELPALDGNETELYVYECFEDNLGDNTFCEGAEVRIVAEAETYFEIRGEWHWSINELDGDADADQVSWYGNIRAGTGNPVMNGNLPFLIYGTNEMYFTFEEEGLYEICVEEFVHFCETIDGPLCTEIRILPEPDPEELGPFSVCKRDVEFLGWDGPEFPTYTNIEWKGGFMTLEDILNSDQNNDDHYEVERFAEDNDCGCSYSQTLLVDLVGDGDPGEADLYLSECQLPYTWFDLTFTNLEDFNGEEIALVGGAAQTSYTGINCDSFAVITVTEIIIQDTVYSDGCANGQQLFTFEIPEIEIKIGNQIEDIGFSGLQYQWIDSISGQFVTPLTDNPTTALADGTYYISVTGFMDDINHNATSVNTSPVSFVECLFGPHQIVNPVIPAPQLIPFDDRLCPEELLNVQFSIQNPNPQETYNWSIPNSLFGQETISQDRTQLTIADISNIGTAQIGVFATTPCGTSETTFISITLVPSPDVPGPFIIEGCIDEVIPSSITNIIGYTYTWSRPGAMFSSNPQGFTYSSAGTYTQDVTIQSTEGCISEGSYEINIYESPPQPIIRCVETNNPGIIIFEWDEEPGLVYNVNATAQNGQQNGNQLRFENLAPNSEISATVTVSGPGPAGCNMSEFTLSCITDDCDLPMVDPTNFMDLTFCQNEAPPSLQYNIVPPAGLTGSYFGPGLTADGMIDFTDSTFDIAGTYELQFIYTDQANACSESVSVFITVEPEIEITNPTIPDLCPNELPFIYTPNIIGGDGSALNYFYEYRSPSGTETTSGPGTNLTNFEIPTGMDNAGQHELKITINDNSCTTEEIIQFEVYDVIIDVLTSTAVNVCNETPGDHPTLLNLDPLQDTQLFGEWFDETGALINTASDFNFEGRSAGIIEFLFRPDQSFNCLEQEYILAINIIDCGCPLFNVTAPESICAIEGEYPLTNTLDGIWSINNSLISIQANQTLIIPSNAMAGTYELTFDIDDVLMGCTEDTTIMLELLEPPTPIFKNDISICNAVVGSGETMIDLDTLVSGKPGTWISPNQTLVIDSENIVSFLGEDLGNYTFEFVALSDNDCPDITYEVNIRVKDCSCIDFAIAPIGNLCSDQPAIDLSSFLINPDNLSGQWEVDASSSSNEILPSDYSDGLHEVSYILDTSLGGNCPDSAFSSFTIFDVCEVNLTESELNVCINPADTQYPFEINLESLELGDDGEWVAPPSYNNGVIDDITLVSFEGVTPDSYLFRYRSIEDAGSPCIPTEVILKVNVIDCSCPIFVLNDRTLCNDLSGVFNLDELKSADTEPFGLWTFTSGPSTVNITNFSEISLDGLSGDYTFTYATDLVVFGCDNSATVTLSIIEQSDLTIEPNITVCDQISSTAESTLNFNTLSNNAEGTWQAPNNYNGDFSDVSQVSFEGSDPGDYIFTFIADVEMPCTPLSYMTTVKVLKCCEAFDVVTDLTPPCFESNNGSITISSISGGDGDYSYSLDNGNSYIQTNIFENLSSGTYELLIEDGEQCQTIVDNIIINDRPDQSIWLGDDRDVSIEEVNYELFFSHPGQSINFTSLIWSVDGDVVCTGDLNDCGTHLLALTGQHEVCLDAVDEFGCSSSDCVTITTVIPQKIYIPTAFSPGSTDNDVFYIGSDEFLEVINTFIIYDRWGEIVYDAGDNYVTNDPKLGWNGTKNDKVIEQGVYVYYIEAQFIGNEEPEIFTGTLTMFR